MPLRLRLLFFIPGLIICGFFAFQQLNAETSLGASLSSDNFRILDSQHGAFGGISSSSSGTFLLLGSIGDIAIGSSSITNFKINSGFLYYPKVVAPVLNSATAGTTQVSLSWTAAAGYQGFSISGYNVCTSVGGASYSCSDVGNTTSSTRTGLTASIQHTFKIEAKDGLGNVISVSNELSAIPTAASSGGGGGGGGGSYLPPSSGTGSITISGTSYPQSTVYLYNDGVLVTSIQAGGNAGFQITLNNISAGTHTVGINSQDPNGRRSLTTTFVVNIVANTTVTLTDVLLPPTIDINTTQLNRGDTIRIFGQAQPISEVNVHIFSEEVVNKVIADSNGAYALSFGTQPLEEDEHTTKSRAVLSQVVSPFSQVLQFLVGKKGSIVSKSADLNKDNRVNIIDFSILLYWWGTTASKGLEVGDINNDNKVNIVDFSILLFQWTH